MKISSINAEVTLGMHEIICIATSLKRDLISDIESGIYKIGRAHV